MTDWRQAISFSDRINHTSQMHVSTLHTTSKPMRHPGLRRFQGLSITHHRRTAAYKKVNPGCEPSAASRYAKISEETARGNALNLEEYTELCAKAVHFLLTSAVPGPVEDHHTDEHVFPNLPHDGARIGRFINAVHHRDGLFSEVFCASHPEAVPGSSIPAVVALKITTPSMMTAPHDPVREARILEAARGENVVSLLETFQQPGGHLVLVFPFMPYDLNSVLHRCQLTDISRQTILRDVFTGLEHLHSLGIVHRDIKPSNILLTSLNGPAYLADFGIAWSPSDHASEPPTEKILDVGTTCYRPPELLFGYQAYGPELDLWAAGCVVAQVVALNEHTLFDVGDLGSELALIKSIFETLGTPDLEIWPEAANMPDWGKMNFTKYPGMRWSDILPEANEPAVDLVKGLVVYESSNRTRAELVLKHPYLQRKTPPQQQ